MKKVLYILGQLSDEDVEWMSQSGRCVEYRGGDTIIQAGQPISALFIVLSGNAVVKLPSGIEVARIGAGEILGEMSLVDRRPPSATVVAVDVTTLLAIDHTAITRKLDHDYGFAARMYRAIATFLSDRMRNTNAQLGFGSVGKTVNLDDEEELDDSILDNVHLAGIRFEHILEKFSTSVRGKG